ncbi:MAG: hypothetical protein NT138_16900 [Planctomycetales bacterium]|jgi:hypothetical protein|nr:hypothetical protein [Planctomycetales bacterium]
MSRPLSDMTPDLREPKNLPADRVYERPGESLHLGLVLQVSVFVVVAAMLMLLAPEAPWSIRLLIIALVMLTLKRWGGVLVLMLVQGDLVLREGRDMAILNGSGGVLFVLVVMAVLMFVARQRELLQQIARSSLLQVVREFLNSSEAPAESPKEFSIPAARIFSSVLRGITLLFGCVVIARVVIGMLPTNREVTAGLRDFIDVDPSLMAGAMLIVCLFAVWIAVSEVSWRQMTTAQARMYLRSAFLKLHYADLRMIVRKRLKVRQQRLAAAKAKSRKEGN